MHAAHAHLWCKSHYSFLEGASSPEELVQRARELDLRALAITDRDGVYGVVRAHSAAKAKDGEPALPLIIGAEVSVDDESTITLLARNHDGYRNLCRLLSRGRLRSPKGSSRVTWEEIAEHAKGQAAIWGGARARIARPDLSPALLHTLKDAFGEHLYAAIARHQLPEDQAIEAHTRRHADAGSIPLVASKEVLYHHQARRDLHDVMTCIRARCTIHEAGTLLRPNRDFALASTEAFYAQFRDDPALVAQTRAIADTCTFSLDELRYVYPAEHAPEGLTPDEWLRHLTFEGAKKRYANAIPNALRQQLERELTLIQELDYGGYFLTMKEIVDYCDRQGILCQGRGSAANSAVCYCLGITAVDPVRMELLFERFLSKERAEPPDIDLDIEHQRREEVIQYMYERHGRSHAAMVANVIRYRARSAFREVATALAIPRTQIDQASKHLSHWSDIPEETLAQAGMDTHAPITQHALRLAKELIGAPRHLSIHPGGFILGSAPVHDLVPIENATMENRTVIQWDKNDVEELGLFKVDLLALGALTQLKSAFQMIQKHHGHPWSMATIPADDSATWEMLGNGDTIGVFQVESRAQMAMLPRLKPKTFHDLVIQISIVRPGPITGGMVHPYLRRRNGEEPITWPHPSLEPVLRRTLGVPLFQEQVMKLAMVAADYTPGEADQLRRDMGAWRVSGRIEAHRERLIERMTAKGIAREFAERIFEQIRGFGEYGFPESHAASFALIAWASAWLRTHYPEVFTAALLNAQPMGFYSVSTILNDARQRRIEIHPIDIQTSAWETTLEPLRPNGATAAPITDNASPKFALRLGFRLLKGLSQHDANAILLAREGGPFATLSALIQRTHLSEASTLKLASAGALDTLIPQRRDAIWAVRSEYRQRPLPLLDAIHSDVTSDTPQVSFPPLEKPERLRWDYEQLGASAEDHILAPWRSALRAQNLPSAEEVRAMKDGARVRYAGVVICRQRPGTAAGVVFITLEDETGVVNLVVWRDVWEKHAAFIKTHSLLGVRGRLQVQNAVTHLIAETFWEPTLPEQAPAVRSRDFH